MPAFGPVGTKVGALCAKMGGTAEAIFTAFVPFYTGQRLFFYLIGGVGVCCRSVFSTSAGGSRLYLFSSWGTAI